MESDPWLKLELFIERVGRLTLHAHALAERLERISGGTATGRRARAARVRRLRKVVCLGRRAIVAAALNSAPADRFGHSDSN